MIQPPDKLSYKIDQSLWGNPFDPADKEQQKEEIINTYITWAIEKILWKDFREDFEGRSLESFNKGNRGALKRLRSHLVTHGVQVRPQMGSVSYAKTLQERVDNDKPHKLTKDEILDHLEEHRG
ncbi:hypothetical protein GcM1_227076 [Golovinomyces cichoracearum]|uniref:Uncharacterized protein n=1 Tax=Golovinomyces cichoracearum TaxID=62708 RepID=A0A420IPP7_9PEZI|nr:hypothetical protein GcM1_227076 [Golovinomyces cichoracearum]